MRSHTHARIFLTAYAPSRAHMLMDTYMHAYRRRYESGARIYMFDMRSRAYVPPLP